MDGQCAADRPQDYNERSRRQNSCCHSSGEIDRRFSRNAHVVSYASFWILVGAANEIELIMAAVIKPAIDETVIEPLAPSPLHRHARANLHDAQQDASR